MNRFLPAFQFIFIGAVWAAPVEPVSLEHGLSPDKRFEVVLEADKDTPSFARYELKGDSFPKLLVREISTGRIIGRTEWQGDTNSDEMTLRSHTAVLWRPDGRAVAINTSERFYSHTTILVHDPKRHEFIQASFPDYEAMTGFAPPNSDDLRPRGHSSAIEWNSDNLLVYTFHFSPMPSYKGKDSLHHRVIIHVAAEGMKIIAREALETLD